MANRFIRKTGSDSNGGTSPSDAWLTIGKALGSSGAASGDIVFIGAGVYREQVTAAMTSPAAETRFVADVDGAMTGDVGEVRWTAYDVSDTALPTGAGSLLDLAGRDNLTFEGIVFCPGKSSFTGVSAISSLSTGITFRDCTFLGAGTVTPTFIYVIGVAATALNWTLDRCRFLITGNGIGLQISLPAGGAADYDANFLIRNCLFVCGATGISVTGTATGSFFGGGVRAQSCTFFGQTTRAMTASPANGATGLSLSIPCTLQNSLVVSGATGVGAGTSGQITEDYCLFYCASARSNVSAGANSKADFSVSALLHIGQEVPQGRFLRPFGTPSPGSPLLGFGNAASPPTVDILNRPRPAGGQSTANAVGAYERHDTGARETTTVDAGGVGMVLAGPGDHDFDIPVNSATTTISVRARYDTNHGSGSKPQVLLLANAEIGVTAQTLTMTAAADTWEALAFSAFTPTAKGTVRLRLVSRAAAGTGKAFFDTASVPDVNTGDFGNYNRGEPVPVLTGTGGSLIVNVEG